MMQLLLLACVVLHVCLSPLTAAQYPVLKVNEDGGVSLEVGDRHSIDINSSITLNGGVSFVPPPRSFVIEETSVFRDKAGVVQEASEALDAILDNMAWLSDPLFSTDFLLKDEVGAVKETLSALEHDLSGILVDLFSGWSSQQSCASEPCLNGGVCIQMVDAFYCQCPDKWTGERCDVVWESCEVAGRNPCDTLSSTGCHAAHDSVYCDCKEHYFGVHCQYSHSLRPQGAPVCSMGSDESLCGHGLCVNGGEGYSCQCEAGWTANERGLCLVDTDECLDADLSAWCGGTCHNTVGGFHCGSCPPGFFGNGVVCEDTDECAISNGGCSSTPPVECFNLNGSHSCGPCPDGYQGDGRYCRYVGACALDNGGCGPHQVCVPDPRVSEGYRVCECDFGFVRGASGECEEVAAAAAVSADCVHGIQVNHSQCQCEPGYSGPNCLFVGSNCSLQCGNGGHCMPHTPSPSLPHPWEDPDRTEECLCSPGFFGRFCEEHLSNATIMLHGDTNTILLTQSNNYRPNEDITYFALTTPEVGSTPMELELTIHWLDIEYATSCDRDWLRILGVWHEPIVRCGKRSEPETFRFLARQFRVQFHSDAQHEYGGALLTWRPSREPRAAACGPMLRNATDVIELVPGHDPVTTCSWVVQPPPTGSQTVFHVGQILGLDCGSRCSTCNVQIWEEVFVETKHYKEGEQLCDNSTLADGRFSRAFSLPAVIQWTDKRADKHTAGIRIAGFASGNSNVGCPDVLHLEYGSSSPVYFDFPWFSVNSVHAATPERTCFFRVVAKQGRAIHVSGSPVPEGFQVTSLDLSNGREVKLGERHSFISSGMAISVTVTLPSVCPLRYFLCEAGVKQWVKDHPRFGERVLGECMPEDWTCDGVQGCNDAADEPESCPLIDLPSRRQGNRKLKLNFLSVYPVFLWESGAITRKSFAAAAETEHISLRLAYPELVPCLLLVQLRELRTSKLSSHVESLTPLVGPTLLHDYVTAISVRDEDVMVLPNRISSIHLKYTTLPEHTIFYHLDHSRGERELSCNASCLLVVSADGGALQLRVNEFHVVEREAGPPELWLRDGIFDGESEPAAERYRPGVDGRVKNLGSGVATVEYRAAAAAAADAGEADRWTMTARWINESCQVT